MASMTKDIEQSVRALESALSTLEAAVKRRVEAGSEDLQIEVQTLSSDRARLAENLDKSSARIEALEAINRDVSARLATAMETVSAVLQAELEDV
jgi:prefoldin subunit 5